MVGLDGKVPQYLASIIFNHTFWLMVVPLLAYIYPKLPAYVPLDSSPDPIMSVLILLLRHFAAFADEMINSFINLTAHSTSTVLLRFVDFGFDEVRPNGLLLSC